LVRALVNLRSHRAFLVLPDVIVGQVQLRHALVAHINHIKAAPRYLIAFNALLERMAQQ